MHFKIAVYPHSYIIYKINKNFTLLFEIGYTMSEKVYNILINNGYYAVSKIKDYSGHIRVIKAEKTELKKGENENGR